MKNPTANSEYLYFITIEGNEHLLKKELQISYPKLTLSFSRPGIVTFKIPQDFQPALPKMNILFSLSVGKAIGKVCKKKELIHNLKKILYAKESQNKNIFLNPWRLTFDLQKEFDNLFIPPAQEKLSPDHLMIEVIECHEDEFLIGQRSYAPQKSFISYTDPLLFAHDVPSRAYYKIREAFALIDPQSKLMKETKYVLDIGAAPGGASLFFIENGQKVIGVDSAEMDIRFKEIASFTHLKIPIQKVGEEELKSVPHIDWIAIDINLDPKNVIKEIEKLFIRTSNKLSKVKGIFYTVKLTEKFDPFAPKKGVHYLINKLLNLGFSYVIPIQIPSNRSEFLIIGLRLK